MAKLTHAQVFGAIESTYRLAEANFGALYGAATTAKEKDAVKALYSSARDAYWKAVGETLDDNNEVVEAILNDLKQANKDLKDSLKGLQNLRQTLDFLTEAVRLAGSLVTLAAA